MSTHKLWMALALAAFALVPSSYADDINGVFTFQGGQFTTLSGPASLLTDPSRIDNAGDFLLRDNNGPTYIFHNGTVTPFSLPGPGATFGISLSSNGTILGRQVFFTSTYFLDSNGAVTMLPHAPGFLTAVNNAGNLIGTSFDGQFEQLFNLTTGALTNISPPGSGSVHLFSINDHNQILGRVGFTAFIWDAGTFTILPIPANCAALDMNNLEQIVGDCFYGNRSEGFLYSGGAMTFINYDLNANTNDTFLTGINDSGRMVGFFTDVPEPLAAIQLLCGAAMLLGFSRFAGKPREVYFSSGSHLRDSANQHASRHSSLRSPQDVRLDGGRR